MSRSGSVKFFNNMKGFGFITPSDGGDDIFVHINDVSDGNELVEGDEITYEEEYDERKGKTHAVSVSGGSGGPRQKGGGGYGGGKGGYGGGKGGGKGGYGGGGKGGYGGGGYGGGKGGYGGGGGSYGGGGYGGGGYGGY